MLSYRHAFHAGNHADVLKHLTLTRLLKYLAQKDKAFWFIDTHAGAGCYALDSNYSRKNAEHENGIAQLWGRSDLPAPLAEYVELVRQNNPEGDLKLYPGSPLIALDMIREQDRMRLFELHPGDFELLKENFAPYGNRVISQKSDGFGALKSLLPPPPRRALVLIDPPYEIKQDYTQVIEAIREGIKRFPTGIYAIWYPLLQRAECKQLPDQLSQLPVKSWLQTTLSVQAPSVDGFGMHGSGMFVINPPWTLASELKLCLPYLVDVLEQDSNGQFTLESHEN